MSTQTKRSTTGRLVLGTSGFAYKHWREVFYPPGTPQSRWLETYAEHFSAVELNVSFYRLPRKETFEGWAARTPRDFEFVVKGSRTITHYRRLKDAAEPLGRLMEAASGLSDKLSCLLWQLPPHTAPDIDVLDRFCELLAEKSPGPRHAFEFRDARWFSAEVLDLLAARGHAVVAAFPAPEGAPQLEAGPFAYLRFHHGAGEGGGFTADELTTSARTASSVLAEGKDVYAFFNNDPGGWAPRNAVEFGSKLNQNVVSH